MDRLKLKPLGAMLLFGGFIVLWMLFRQGTLPLVHPAQTVECVVVRHYTSPVRNSAYPGTFLRVRCTESGQEHTVDREVDEDFWNNHPAKSSAAVTVHGNNWATARIQGASNDNAWMWLKTVGGLLAMALGVSALVYDRWFK